MARIKNTETNEQTVDSATDTQTTQDLQPEQTTETSKERTPTKKEEKAVLPPAVEALLKLYSSYPFLYVDNLGGVFTKDTPEHIRGNAVGYQNPFYNN